MKNLCLWFVCFGVFAALFFGFIFVVISSDYEVNTEKPFLTHITGIAVSNEYIYTLDQTFNNICKYNIDGEFICRISFRTPGATLIFCDELGRLCRFDVRGKIVNIYDDEGTITESYDIAFEDLVDKGYLENYNQPKSINYNGIEYKFKNHIITNSYLFIGSNKVVVESVGYHIFSILYILLGISAVAFGGYNLIMYIHRSCREEHPGFKFFNNNSNSDNSL